MGFFGSIEQEKYDRQYDDRQLLRRMWEYFKPFTGKLAAVAGLLLVTALTSTFSPILVSRGVGLLNKEITNQVILLLFGAVLLVGVLSWLSNWGRRRLMVRMITGVILNLRVESFQAAMAHDLSFYDRFSSGKIVTRITSDTQDFGNTITLVTDLISQFIQAVILAVILIGIDWKLSLIMFAFLPVIFLFAISFRRLARRVTRTGMRAMANVNAVIKETVSGIAVAKNFRQEGAVFGSFDEANKLSFRVNWRRGMVLSIVFPVLNALGGIGTGALVYAGGISVAEGIVTAGAWFLFLQSLDRFFMPVMNLSNFWTQIQTGLSAAERVFALIDAESQVIQTQQQPAPVLRGEILFEHVTFQYTEQEKVLEDFNLHIAPGENLALVGHTGAGKTSVAKLVARFYEFQAGKIWIDGLDIRSFDLNSYRSQLGIVSQAPFLFSGTVAENICFSCASSSAQDDMLHFANQIGDGEWVETLPQGFETQVGERGSRLSMGQRQLVALLRVLVNRPKIFILDEATASVDPFTEWQIQQALNLILRNTTSILIAHRLSTVKAADRILVMRAGKIIEEGNHNYLLANQGHYAELYNTYFRHQSLAYIEQSKSFFEAKA